MKKHPVPIPHAMEYLESHFGEIFTVKEWANGMGYAPNTFWRKFRQQYRRSPSDILLEKKKRELIALFRLLPDLDNTDIAIEFGLTNGNCLYQFVMKHFKCTPSELRYSLEDKNSGVGRNKDTAF